MVALPLTLLPAEEDGAAGEERGSERKRPSGIETVFSSLFTEYSWLAAIFFVSHVQFTLYNTGQD